jgi:ribosomal protein S12 methylthiotransferase accessory factor
MEHKAGGKKGRPVMRIELGGGLAVNAHFKDHIISSDQPVRAGGTGTAPSPFDLFLASIGLCAGFYVQSFCRQREIPTEDISLTLKTERDPERKRVAKIRIDLQLPPEFPQKYRKAVLRAVDQCSVKRHLIEPPEIEVVASQAVPELVQS